MKKPTVRPSLLIVCAVILCTVILYKYGRSIWHPAYARIRGRQTVRSVLKKHTARVRKRFPQWKRLVDRKTITLIAFKQERRLELWKRIRGKHQWIKSYPFTGYSGTLGPKRKEGDLQIPEGIYRIAYLNPNSSYHLSMKVSYPNRFDRKMARKDRRTRLGGDIFIHGKNVTIGCIPIGDRNIEELFTIIATNGVRNTRVLIAPNDLRIRTAPSIKGIRWVGLLYTKLKRALLAYERQTNTTHR